MQVYQLFSSWFACQACFFGGQKLASCWGSSEGDEETVVLVSSLKRDWSLEWSLILFVCAVGAVAVWLGLSNSSVIAAALLFAPLGACLRIELWRAFSFRGTLVANLIGVLCSSLSVLMWRAAGQSHSPIVVVVGDTPAMATLAAAFSFGFSGALSTVSTLMVETSVLLDFRKAVVLWMVSVTCGLSIAFALLSFELTKG